jgi:hypothetical protein
MGTGYLELADGRAAYKVTATGTAVLNFLAGA